MGGAATRCHIQPKMLCSIFAHRAISKPAKTFFSIATGKRCARRAPIGAINMLTNDTSTNAGKYT